MNKPICVLTGYHNDNTIWCGRKVSEWCFENASHAVLNARNQGRLLTCPKCADAIILTLEEQKRKK